MKSILSTHMIADDQLVFFPSTKGKKLWYLSLFVFMLTAFFSKGYHHFDEHFQILEFANYKLGNIAADTLPWEFSYRMRPAIQPSMVVALHSFLELFGKPNPFLLSLILRLLSAGFTFYIVSSLFKLFVARFKDHTSKKWLFFFTFFLWYQLYVGVRFSSENWSANFFFLGFILYNLNRKNLFALLAVGMSFGLAFMFRFQAAFMVLGYLAWMFFIDRLKWKEVAVMGVGGALVVFMGYLIDSWFYQEPTFSFLNYFQQFTMENKVITFESHPWWYYFSRFFNQGVPPLSLLMVLGILIFTLRRWKDAVSWIILPFLLAHFLVDHKELRFLFPIIAFLPLIAVVTIEQLSVWFKGNRLFKIFLQLVMVVNVALVAVVCFRPADPYISLYESVYKNYKDAGVLYHLGNNPYHRVTEIEFYKRPNLEIRHINTVDEIDYSTNEIRLLAVDQKAELPSDLIASSNLCYSTFPKWMLLFNINNWQGRTKSWKVYQL